MRNHILDPCTRFDAFGDNNPVVVVANFVGHRNGSSVIPPWNGTVWIHLKGRITDDMNRSVGRDAQCLCSNLRRS